MDFETRIGQLERGSRRLKIAVVGLIVLVVFVAWRIPAAAPPGPQAATVTARELVIVDAAGQRICRIGESRDVVSGNVDRVALSLVRGESTLELAAFDFRASVKTRSGSSWADLSAAENHAAAVRAGTDRGEIVMRTTLDKKSGQAIPSLRFQRDRIDSFGWLGFDEQGVAGMYLRNGPFRAEQGAGEAGSFMRIRRSGGEDTGEILAGVTNDVQMISVLRDGMIVWSSGK